MKKQTLLFLLLIINECFLFSQTLNTNRWRKSERDSMEKAQSFYDDNLYDLAAPIFISLQKQHPNEPYLQYVTGVSALERSDLHTLSLQLIQQVYAKNKKIENIGYNLARALHLNYKFDESLALIEEIKNTNKKLSPKQNENLDILAVYCKNAKILLANPLPAKIENLGKPPNTEASEYVPVLSADEETMVYTYAGDSSLGGKQNNLGEASNYGRYFEDVYITHKKNGAWEYGKNIGSTINTLENDAAVSLSPDGHMLFTFRDDRKNGGDLYVSYLQGSDWSFPIALTGDINRVNSWEGSCSISADGRTLYFSSDRKEGYGGRDLYRATKMSDGSWGNVKNMGDKINTKYDEDAPFIHPSGDLLVFSSSGEKSMGNYDVFKTVLNPLDSSWNAPENLGYPINSPDRDSYYVLSASGEHGYYSSGKEGGYGLQDIYMVTPGLDGFKPSVLIVKGTITLHGQPVEADILVNVTGTTESFNAVKSNSIDGKYLVSLLDGNDYKVVFKLNDSISKTYTIEGKNLTGYNERIINVEFADTANTTVKNKEPKAKENPVTIDSAAIAKNTTKADKKVEGLYFRVQIAAYKYPQNYNASHLTGLGKIERLILDDGICRITIGGDFYTISSAHTFLQKVRLAGQKDSFVTAIYKGKRVYLEDLYKMGLINETQ